MYAIFTEVTADESEGCGFARNDPQAGLACGSFRALSEEHVLISLRRRQLPLLDSLEPASLNFELT